MSAPKEVALNEGEVVPVETPTTPKNAEGETVVVAQVSVFSFLNFFLIFISPTHQYVT